MRPGRVPRGGEKRNPTTGRPRLRRTADGALRTAPELRYTPAVARPDLPEDVQAFVASYIDSVVQLELLLLLRADPGRAWTPPEVARELRIEPAWTATELGKLAVRGLLAPADGVPTYRYAPGKPELEAVITALAHAYAERRVSVINLVYSRPSDAIRSFAEAFRFRKD